jgi:DNA-binding beta-propeller fold protein YncE
MLKPLTFCILLAATPALAASDQILIGLDETSFFGPQGEGWHAQGPDSVLILDAHDPAHPRIQARIPMINSVWGPPVNLQITPDGHLGLVTEAVLPTYSHGTWAPGSGNLLHLIDMDTLKPLPDVKVGLMPQGLAIRHDGKLALLANRNGHSISVLRIAGKTVTEIAQVPVGDEVAAVTFVPRSNHAFFVKNTVNRIGVLDIEGERVTYDPTLDMPAGFKPYNIAATPDGKLALVANNDIPGNTATVTVLSAAGPHPHVIQTVDVGDGPEGFAMAPDGSSFAAALLHGGFTAYDHWAHHKNGGVVMLKVEGSHVRLMPGEVKVGEVPEGIAYSHDGHYVYVGDFNERRLHVLKVGPDGLSDTGTSLALPGHPGSMRGPAP